MKYFLVVSLLLLTACDKYKVGDCIVKGPIIAKVTGTTSDKYEAEIYAFGQDLGAGTADKKTIDNNKELSKVKCKDLGL